MGGNRFMCFPRTEYPRLLNKLRFTASFATLFGATKEIRGTLLSLIKTYLKVRLGELINFPSLKTLSRVFLSTLFFLGSILKTRGD